MTKERIESIRKIVLPFVAKKLKEIDYEGLGESDAKEFTKDFNEILNLAEDTLESNRNCTHLSKIMQDIKTDIWYSGVNMAGEYKGVWVRYKTIEEIIDKHINGQKNNESPCEVAGVEEGSK